MMVFAGLYYQYPYLDLFIITGRTSRYWHHLNSNDLNIHYHMSKDAISRDEDAMAI